MANSAHAQAIRCVVLSLSNRRGLQRAVPGRPTAALGNPSAYVNMIGLNKTTSTLVA